MTRKRIADKEPAVPVEGAAAPASQEAESARRKEGAGSPCERDSRDPSTQEDCDERSTDHSFGLRRRHPFPER